MQRAGLSLLSRLPPDVAILLAAPSVRALLARFGGRGGLPPFDAADPLAVAEALSYRLVPSALAEVLALLARLATPLGREALLEALARDRDARAIAALERFAPADLACRVLCTQDAASASAIRRALIRVARHFAPRPWYTLLWSHAALPARHESLLDAARAVHGKQLVRAWLTDVDAHGVLRAIAVHRGPAERVATFVKGVTRVRTVRSLACDVIRWDPRDGRVSFCLARPSRLEEWVSAISTANASTEGASFSDRPAYTHKSLHEKGEAWLESLPLPAGITSITVIHSEVDAGKRLRVRSDRALTDMHATTGRARGYLRCVTIRFTVAGHDEPVDATIDLPSKVTLSDGRFEEELRAVMEALETHAPGSLPDDLVSLVPKQPEWRWLDLLGAAAFARAVEKRVLVRAAGKHPSGREHRRWGTLLRAFDVPGEQAAYVVGEDLAIRAFEAKPEALVWYAVDWSRVAATLRAQTGLREATVPDAPEGLLAIGAMESTGRTVLVFSVVRAVAESEVVAVLKQLRLACGRATPALLVPRGRSLGGAVTEVAVSAGEQLGVEDVAWVAGRIADEHEMGDDVELSTFATAETPLVLSIARQEAWYGRVRLLLTDNQLAMLFTLATVGTWMKSTDLGRKITPGAELPDQTVRKARQILGERLRASFKAAGVPMIEGLEKRIVIADRIRGCRLGVGVIMR